LSSGAILYFDELCFWRGVLSPEAAIDEKSG
jgi:hypothetical protein